MDVINQASGQRWTLYHGDCVEVTAGLPAESIDFAIFSPPFASLYTYSNSERDMGNCRDEEEFFGQFRFLVRELARVMRPGRNVSFHCMNLPSSKAMHGYIGIRDFRGALLKAFEDEGFIFHSEVCIWKDPVTAMKRTKALGLLHKQLCKDSAMSRQGIPDYLVTMRKPGENAEPVRGRLERYIGAQGHEEFEREQHAKWNASGRAMKFEDFLSIQIWQRYASPVWMDIAAQRTLQREPARGENDERHICPLQLDVIERAVLLWSNPGETVLSPFAGIGSEGWGALRHGRQFIGIELKESYWRVAVENLKDAERAGGETDMVSLMEQAGA
jgi:DNA modification methylase